MKFIRKINFHATMRIAYFAGILGAFAFAARAMCIFHAGRTLFHVLAEVTTFLMLAYVWGKLLAGLWSVCSRLSGYESKSVSPSPAVKRRLRTTPFARANRRAYGHNA